MENTRYEVREDIEINIGGLIQTLLKWLWLIILVAVSSGVAVMLVSMIYLTPMYESSTTVYIMNSQGNDNSSATYSDFQISTLIGKDYEQLIKSREVLETAIEELNLDMTDEELSRNITVSSPSDSRILEITVKNPDPSEAQMIADKIRELSAKQIVDIMGIQAVNTVDAANFPTTPSSPNIKKNTVLAALLGFILTCVIVLAVTLLNDRVYTAEDVEKYLKLSVLGTIPIDYEAIAEKKKRNSRRTSLNRGKR